MRSSRRGAGGGGIKTEKACPWDESRVVEDVVECAGGFAIPGRLRGCRDLASAHI
jgi:hypothetical protein